MASERTKRRLCLLAAETIRVGVGVIFGGGRLPRVYNWTTEWNIDAPLTALSHQWR